MVVDDNDDDDGACFDGCWGPASQRSKLVLSSERLEDEDIKFSAAKYAVKQEVSQCRQDIQCLKEENRWVF
eukprot:CAMPEP_0175168348 /NCGR_PEP_ID=MMETSP0087-20121206/28904_1 /TAXON_ID=136419 /ORGANISM="Unknown Unknown, Strain D1" /LENGTH=70 /DNA_ID=CAMNT_0016458451 /DNA_START=259 /DNA_END=471 /DNA_ORIENTATION=-